MKIINILLLLLLSYILLLSKSILLNKNSFNKKCLNCPNCSFGYIGGGALIYESDNNGTKKMILGIDYKNELTDLGDKINFPNERIWNTVSEIINSKTFNVLNTKPNEIIINDYIDIDSNTHKYRCYLFQIDKFEINKYKYNKFTFNNKFKKYFNEINDIIIIPESSIKKLLENEYDIANNSGELIPYMISSRLKKILNIYFYERNSY